MSWPLRVVQPVGQKLNANVSTSPTNGSIPAIAERGLAHKANHTTAHKAAREYLSVISSSLLRRPGRHWLLSANSSELMERSIRHSDQTLRSSRRIVDRVYGQRAIIWK